jgi:phosphatidylserine decarboxylase
MKIVKKTKNVIKTTVLTTLDLLSPFYFLLEKLVPPEVRWPSYILQKNIQENKKPDKHFLKFFMRDPKRNVPKEKNIIVSPADGIVTNIYEKENKRIIRIYMDFYDVHVQRIPIDGRVISVEEAGCKVEKGSGLEKKYFDNPELYDKDYLFPAQKVTTLNTKIGEVVIRQVATILVRRIVTYASKGDEVKIGQKLGMILFGSIVVVELPEFVKIEVVPAPKDKKGRIRKRLIGGETIIARY